MDALTNLALTSLLAAFGYLFTVGIIQPLLRYERKKTDIGIKLNYYSNIVTSPGTSKVLADEAERVLRTLAVELEAEYLGVQFREMFVKLRAIPLQADIVIAKRDMIFLSNSVHRGNVEVNHIKLGEIFTVLRIDEVDIDNSIVAAMEIYDKQEK